MVNNYKEHQQDGLRAIEDVKTEQECFDLKKQAFDKANADFITAQTSVSQVCAEIGKLQLNITLYKKDVQQYFDLIADSKRALTKARSALADINSDIDNLFNNKDIANMQNDIATSQFHAKEDIASNAAQELRKVNQEVFDLRASKAAAGDDLGIANFNLRQATNSILVAQAAKEQADKAVAIVTAQLKQQDANPKTYIFSGCEAFSYPSYSGSATVSEVGDGQAVLNSGHTIVYGACTLKTDFKKGDLVQFDGYWKDGCIHGIKLSK
jgi:hypothetical protein